MFCLPVEKYIYTCLSKTDVILISDLALSVSVKHFFINLYPHNRYNSKECKIKVNWLLIGYEHSTVYHENPNWRNIIVTFIVKSYCLHILALVRWGEPYKAKLLPTPASSHIWIMHGHLKPNKCSERHATIYCIRTAYSRFAPDGLSDWPNRAICPLLMAAICIFCAVFSPLVQNKDVFRSPA